VCGGGGELFKKDTALYGRAEVCALDDSTHGNIRSLVKVGFDFSSTLAL